MGRAPFTTILGRWATGDTELAGVHINAGDMLLLGLAPGNVDPQIRPDQTVPVHGNRSHLAFSSGPHECPGQDIGRAIADTGIDTLLTRLPDLELAVPEDGLRWTSSLMSRHLVALPVRFTPRGTSVTAATRAPAPVAAAAGRSSARGAASGAGLVVGPAAGPPLTTDQASSCCHHQARAGTGGGSTLASLGVSLRTMSNRAPSTGRALRLRGLA